MALNIFELFGEIVIKTQNAKDEIGAVTSSAEDLAKKFGQVSGGADDTGKRIGSTSTLGSGAVWLGNMFTTLTSKAVSLLGSITRTGFDYNAQMETYITAFTTMLGGNASAAEAFIEDIRDLASKTPMEMAGLAGNAQTLLGFGLASESVIDTLQMLGDVAQGDQQKLDSIVLAYSQIMAAQKLNAQDANQLINAGVPIWDMLAKEIGVSVGEVRKMSEEGQISADIVTKAFQNATSEGGLFYQAMEKQAETFNGQLSTMKDNAEQTLGSLFDPFFEIAKSEVFPQISESIQVFGTFISENKEALAGFAETLGKIAANSFDSLLSFMTWCIENKDTAGIAFTVIGTAVGVIAASANPLLTVVAALAAIVLNWNSIVEWLQPAIDEWNKLVDAIDAATTAVERFFGVNNGSGVSTSPSGATRGGGSGKGFANGLYRVPYDGFSATLHKDEAVLNRLDAQEWRTAQMGGGMMSDTSRLESMMGNMVNLMQQMVANAGNGQTIVLDSGVLVGQLAPQMDTALGSIANRRGRRS